MSDDVTASRLKAVSFPGPAGTIEGLWKEASGPPRGSAVFAHPHPLHGGTLHNKVVFRASRALTAAGYATLRFNFRGVGQSEGRHDGGRGEIDDFRAALDEAVRRGGLPVLAGGFSFGSSVALQASAADERVAALIAIGLPLASLPVESLPRPRVPALFVTGERDAFGPPALLAEFVRDSGEVVIVPGADHFFEGKVEQLAEAIGRFLAALPVGARA
jgi:alpha/beta superfamily hydrolase